MQVSGADAVFKVIMQDWFNIDCRSPDKVDSYCRTGTHLLSELPADALIGVEAKGVSSENIVRHTRCAAVQDDYEWWHRNNESEHSGKLLLVDTSFQKLDANSTAEQVIQVS